MGAQARQNRAILAGAVGMSGSSQELVQPFVSQFCIQSVATGVGLVFEILAAAERMVYSDYLVDRFLDVLGYETAVVVAFLNQEGSWGDASDNIRHIEPPGPIPTAIAMAVATLYQQAFKRIQETR